MLDDDAPYEPRRDDRAETIRWRFECLERAGFPFDISSRLASAPHVDLHRVLDLDARGCPPELVEEIVS